MPNSLAKYTPALIRLRWPSALVLGGVYVISSVLGALYLPQDLFFDIATPVGIAILFFADWRFWPVLVLTSYAAGLLQDMPSFDLLFQIAGNSLEILVAAFLLRVWRVDPIYRRKRDVLYTIAVGAIASLLPALSISVAWIIRTGAVDGTLLLNLYISIFLQFLVITPFALRWCAKPRFGRPMRESFEILVSFALLLACAVGAFIFNLQIGAVPLRYAMVIPLFWIALRLRPRFVTLALVLVWGTVLLGAISGRLSSALTLNELFLILLSAAFLIVTAQEEDRRTNQSLMLTQLLTLENAVARVKGESKARENFIAVLAHELRNPLAPVVSNIELLKLKGARDEDEAQALEMMSDRLESVKKLLENLLDTSRIIEGKVTLEREPLDLCAIVDTAVLSVEHYRQERHQHIRLAYPKVPLWISGDKVRLEQVFSNLLSNASKYSDAGRSIFVHVRPEGDRALVSISDQGAGLAPETFERIFKPFEQVYSGKRKIPGLGIGLALVKNFVELHEGSIRVSSEGLEQGSTFTVSLPRIEAPQPLEGKGKDIGAPHAARTKETRILIVDDNDAAAGALGRLLEALTYKVEYAYSGQQAIGLFAKFAPHAILLDLNMPGISGYETARLLRDRGYVGKIIALSGYGEKDATHTYGDTTIFDSYIVKPVGMSELRSTLSRI